MASTHQVQPQAVTRRGAREKLSKDLWPDCPPSEELVQDVGQTWQSSLPSEQSSSSPESQRGQVRIAAVMLEIQCSLLRGHQHLWKEDGSDEAEGLEQRCAKSQGVMQTCLTLLRSHLENAATAQQCSSLKGDSER